MKLHPFSPLSLRGNTFRNRIAVSPMAQYKGEAGAASLWHNQHLGSFAISGPGLVIFESTSVERRGWGSPVCLALHSDFTGPPPVNGSTRNVG